MKSASMYTLQRMKNSFKISHEKEALKSIDIVNVNDQLLPLTPHCLGVLPLP